MPGPDRAIVHVGLHKTGTTSIQAFLGRKRDALAERGIGFPEGLYLRNNHVELHIAAMRGDRATPIKMRRGIRVDETLRADVRRHVRDSLARMECTTALFSNEGLSWLRYPDEMERLRELIGLPRIHVVVCLREVQAWLRSFDAQMRRNPEVLAMPEDPESCWYCGPGSWLADFETRIDAFRHAFGAGNVSVFDYDRAMADEGNVIPAFLREIGLKPGFGRRVWENLFKNPTTADADVD